MKQPATAPYWQEAKEYLSAADPILAKVIETYNEDEGMISQRGPLETLLRNIVSQQISVKAAATIWERFQNLFPNQNITAAHALSLTEEELRGAGLSRQKVKYIKGTSEAFHAGKMHPESWKDWDDEAIIKELITLPGIGRWTAEMFLMFHLLRPNVLPVQDLGIQKGFEATYNKPWKPHLTEHANTHWAPYCSVASWFLWRSLEPLPADC